MDKTFSIRLSELIFESMNTRNFSEFEKHLADNVVFDFPGNGEISGAKRVLMFFKILLRKYPVLQFTVSDIIVDGNRACAVWTNKGEDATGKPYQNNGMTLIHFNDEKICFISDYFKNTSFVQSA